MSFYDKSSVNPSWSDFLEGNSLRLWRIYEKIEASGEAFNPERENVLRFSRVNLDRVKVVVLGQDPYPQKGAATGRSFEVGNLSSWLEPIRQSSMRNILRAIYMAYEGEESYGEIKKRIESGEFKILPPNRLFDSLEEQGVLFLNTYLTCAVGKPGSHRTLWKEFSRELIRFIDREGIIFFLWGSDAISYGEIIKKGKIYPSRHPMLCGNYSDDFLKNPCFRETKDIIDWRGQFFTEV
ncbi:MAG: uracil-DNA glycosylase [Clostridiales bacterium]|nr:uracil-DNA glycosylase [Clostridiales bacterium]